MFLGKEGPKHPGKLILKGGTAPAIILHVREDAPVEVVTANTLRSVRETIDRFQALNFVGDHAIDEKLNELRQHMNGHDPKDLARDMRDNEALKQQLGNVARAIALEASHLSAVSAVTGEYKRSLDLN